MTINPLITTNLLATNHQISESSARAASNTNEAQGNTIADTMANNAGDMFLKLLVTQLKTQDPTSPMDPTQMVGQMLSMNQLNELIQIRQLMQGATNSTQSNP